MHLLRCGFHVRQRTRRAIILERQIERLVRRIPESRGRLEIPELRRPQAANGLAEHRIEIDLEPSEVSLENWPELERDRVFLVDPARKTELGAQAEFERQPILRQTKTRPETPAGDLAGRSTATRGHEIARHLEVIR